MLPRSLTECPGAISKALSALKLPAGAGRISPMLVFSNPVLSSSVNIVISI